MTFTALNGLLNVFVASVCFWRGRSVKLNLCFIFSAAVIGSLLKGAVSPRFSLLENPINVLVLVGNPPIVF